MPNTPTVPDLEIETKPCKKCGNAIPTSYEGDICLACEVSDTTNSDKKDL